MCPSQFRHYKDNFLWTKLWTLYTGLALHCLPTRTYTFAHSHPFSCGTLLVFHSSPPPKQCSSFLIVMNISPWINVAVGFIMVSALPPSIKACTVTRPFCRLGRSQSRPQLDGAKCKPAQQMSVFCWQVQVFRNLAPLFFKTLCFLKRGTL